MYLPQSSNKQFIFASKLQLNTSTTSYDTTLSPYKNSNIKCYSIPGWCYPSCRPLKIIRKQGVGYSSNTSQPCNTSCTNDKLFGVPLKMLSKDENGQSKTCCTDTQGPVGSKQGNVMSFSGNAKLRSAVQPKNKSYYSEGISYLRSRGNTFASKLNFKNIPNTDYTNPANSSFYEIQEGPLPCNSTIKTTYKPNNKKFATQGAVSSDTRLLRLKYDTIVKNNSSFVTPFNTVLSYSSDPVFSLKNKVNNCNKCANSGNTPYGQASLFNP
jgi:hypothetical protein